MSVYDYTMEEMMATYKLKEHHNLSRPFGIYGSSRVGMKTDTLEMIGAIMDTSYMTRTLGKKQYEMSNHLGNVLSVVSDKLIPLDDDTDGNTDRYIAEILSAMDYSPFGVVLEDRAFGSSAYRHGFNGMERDDEVKGSGNSYDYKERFYDNRLGRFLSIDKLTASFPWYSPFQFAGNRPIVSIDLDGLEELDYVTFQRGMIEGEAQLKKCKFIDEKMDLEKNKFWKRSSTTRAKGMQMRTDQGQTPSQALNDIFDNPEQYSFDCGQYSQCIKLRGIQQSMGEQKFNEYIGEEFNLMNHSSTGIKTVQIYDKVNGIWYKTIGVKTTESGIVENFDPESFVKSANIGTEFTIDYNGQMPFNVIKVGEDQYISQFLSEDGGVMTYDQMVQNLTDKVVKQILVAPTPEGQAPLTEDEVRRVITTEGVQVNQIKESGAVISQ